MSESELEAVAKAAYEQGTGRGDWDQASVSDPDAGAYWRGIARAAIAALDTARTSTGDRSRSHMLAELADMARQTDGA
ncbi:MAG: hypothetical protein ABWY78_17320 [Microvirga sp.]